MSPQEKHPEKVDIWERFHRPERPENQKTLEGFQ